ncbi:MAG: hypothetical protein KGJ87_05240 [Planctomycetota bacterium]|nr:hypothetical protein [Planctomycetota bacterium]
MYKKEMFRYAYRHYLYTSVAKAMFEILKDSVRLGKRKLTDYVEVNRIKRVKKCWCGKGLVKRAESETRLLLSCPVNHYLLVYFPKRKK